jgi:hypothetical protein
MSLAKFKEIGKIIIDKIHRFLIIKVPDCFLLSVELNAVHFTAAWSLKTK